MKVVLRAVVASAVLVETRAELVLTHSDLDLLQDVTRPQPLRRRICSPTHFCGACIHARKRVLQESRTPRRVGMRAAQENPSPRHPNTSPSVGLCLRLRHCVPASASACFARMFP